MTDCDGVLLDWTTDFIKYMTNMGHKLLEGYEHHYSVKRWFDLPEDQVEEYIVKFNSSKWVKYMEPYMDAKKYVVKLHNSGYKFVVITSMGTHDLAYKYRWGNLQTVFGNILDELHIIDYGESKYNILCQYEPTIWIDDAPYNAIDGANAGHTAFLMNHAHNTQSEIPNGIARINSWKQIYEYLNKRQKN